MERSAIPGSFAARDPAFRFAPCGLRASIEGHSKRLADDRKKAAKTYPRSPERRYNPQPRCLALPCIHEARRSGAGAAARYCRRCSRYRASPASAQSSMRRSAVLVCGGAPGGAGPYVIGLARPEAVRPGNRARPWARGGPASLVRLRGPRKPSGASRRSISAVAGRKKGEGVPGPSNNTGGGALALRSQQA
jgi:hypothetical protein